MTTTSRLVGADAVLYARAHWPDLLPELHPVVVRAPHSPMLDRSWTEGQRVGFLVEAYLSFAQLHCPPLLLPRARMQALAARKGEGRAAAERGKLVAAAAVMAGEAWGELEEVVGGGKLPREVAPHSWLLWSVAAKLGVMGATSWRPSGSFPAIGAIFNPGRLLRADTLRVYSHTAADLTAGAARPGDTWAAREGIGAALAAAKAREAAVYRLGFWDRVDCERVLERVGACLAGEDLRALDLRERTAAAAIERRMAAMTEQGTWVWGCWLQPAEVKPRSLVASAGMVR